MRGGCGQGMACGECDDDCGQACGPMGRPIRGPACGGPRARLCGGGDCGSPCDGDCAAPCRRPLARSCSPCGRCGTCGSCNTCGSCGSCSPCGDSCNDVCADPCGNGSCCRTWHRGPLSCLFALFMGGYWCGPSCGNRYWGDFYSDSPDCWDPCDGHGNYTGGKCRSCGRAIGPTTGYGQNYVGNGNVDTGMSEGNIISQSDRVVGQSPNDASQPHRATKP
jgi:hypothetical protein